MTYCQWGSCSASSRAERDADDDSRVVGVGAHRAGRSRSMKLPGAEFRRDMQAVKSLEKLPSEFKHLVFYSEGAADWPHLGPMIERLVGERGRSITFLTSDPSDPGLSIDSPRLRQLHIGSGTARTILFAGIDCRHFVMTLPDLGKLWLKRSPRPVHYIYVFHSLNSTHTAYRTGAFDGFDTILCAGPHHVDEIRRTEEVYGLPKKQLIEHGSAKLDSVLTDFADAPLADDPSPQATVVVAPTWGESSLIEQPHGRDVIGALTSGGIRTVLRLHPMTVRRLPELISNLQTQFGGDPLFAIEDDMNANESWMRADVMVSDWSGAAIEYAFGLLRPVIYLDTPAKIMNPEWQKLGIPSFESTVRQQLGRVVDPSAIGSLPQVVHQLRSDHVNRARVLAARSGAAFNIGTVLTPPWSIS